MATGSFCSAFYYRFKYLLDRKNGDESSKKLFQIGGEYSPEMILYNGHKGRYTNSRYQYLYLKHAMVDGINLHPQRVSEAYFCSDGKDIYVRM